MSNIVPIAIIGIGCRLPGDANNPQQLWDMLHEGRSGQVPIPADRWNAESFYHPDQNAKQSLNFKSGYFLKHDPAAFDARFFGIPPREANGMDPQQRLLLETTYEALEHAGIPLERLKGSDTSVFVAEFTRDYDRMANKDLSQLHLLHVTGKGDAILSNRISYLFDLRGPSLTIDTGCSGSMVALHQACQSVRTGESKLAIVGGAQLLLHPDQSMGMNQIGMMNSEGKCYVFDNRGSGYARGEGVGAVILKRYDEAVRDGDPVHAIIAHSGVNQDGRTLGIHLPNADAQAALAKSVYAAAGLDPAETLYVEAHGTGTQAGDAAEMSSIYEVFCENANRKTDLLVGSIKSNIGHLESVSGIAGLVKAIMILKERTIPANLDFEIPKPALQLELRNILIPTENTPLTVPGYTGPQRISLNGFGYGGTNAHIILESTINHSTGVNGTGALEHATNGLGGLCGNGLQTNGGPQAPSNLQNNILKTNGTLSNGIGANGASHPPNATTDQLFLLSAASESSLRQWAAQLNEWIAIRKPDSAQLRDLSYTLCLRRSLHTWRAAFVARDADELSEQVTRIQPVKSKDGSSVQISFVFTGQGAQWSAMGRELLPIAGSFRRSISRSTELLQSWGAEWNLEAELTRSASETRLGESQLAQPATTAIQIALVDLLAESGIVPSRVCGHSSGEIAAAYAAGVIAAEAALKISYFRGVASAKAKKLNKCRGSMLATGLGETEIAPHIAKIASGRINVACVNSHNSTTISGDEEAIDELSAILETLGVFNRKLQVDTAYHSHHMEAVAETYLSSIQDVGSHVLEAGIAFFSTVASQAGSPDFSPSYWEKNLVSAVHFDKGLTAMVEDMTNTKAQRPGNNIFVEIGPHSALQGPLRQVLSRVDDGSFKYSYMSPLVRKVNAVRSTLDAVRQILETGCAVKMDKVLALTQSPAERHVVRDLPSYAWDHSTKYWHESRLSRDHRLRQFPYHDMLGLLEVVGGDLYRPTWRYHIGTASLPWLRDHVVDGFMIFPGSGYLCMAIEAMTQIVKLRGIPGVLKRFNIRDVIFSKSIIVPEARADGEKQELEMLITLNPSSSGGKTGIWEVFNVVSYDTATDSWNQHCTGLISVEIEVVAHESEVDNEHFAAAQALRDRLTEAQAISAIQLDVDEIYDNFASTGNIYGETFRGLEEVMIGDGQAYAKLRIQDVARSMPGAYMQPHTIHPSTLDVLGHLSVILFKRTCADSPVMPVYIGELSVAADITGKAGDQLVAVSHILPEGRRSATSNTWIFQDSENGPRPVVSLCNSQLIAIGDLQILDKELPFQRNMTYETEWQSDVDHIKQEDFQRQIAERELFAVGTSEGFSASEIVLANEKAAMLYLRDTLKFMRNSGKECTIPHLRHLAAWMERHCTEENGLRVLDSADLEEERSIMKRSTESGPQGEMLARIGQNLPAILTGDADPLPIMLEDDLLSKVYAEGLIYSSYLQMVEYAKLLAFKQPQMSIVEVGAGTGGATLPLLQALEDPVDGLLFKHYCYTDISSGFFEQARAKFRRWEHRMDFRTLDVSKDPLTQPGFEDIKFDVVLASNVLHATPSLDTTLEHVRKLLKPGGRLILIELTNVLAAVNTIFGTLPGWWLSSNGLKDSPLLTVVEWDALCRRHGFDGLEIATPDHIGDTAMATMMVSRTLELPHTSSPDPLSITVITTRPSDTSVTLSGSLCQVFGHQGTQCITQEIGMVKVQNGESYIVLDDTDRYLLKDPSHTEFEAVKRILTESRNILWVSYQENDTPGSISARGMINGLARVVRGETHGMKLVTVDVKDRVTDDDFKGVVSVVFNLANSLFRQAGNEDPAWEREYALDRGQLLIPRLRIDSKFNEWVSNTRSDDDKTRPHRYTDTERPMKLEPKTPGLLGSLRFVDDPRPSMPLGPDEIQLKSHAHGINFKDVFIALGQMPSSVQMVGEVSGVITDVGSEMRDHYKVGDRVAGMHSEPFANCARLKGLHACVLPPALNFVEGASATAVFLTAWHCIDRVARLEKGQTVLIHAASGGVGQAAVQIAQEIGAEVFATVGNTAKRNLIMEKYGIPADHIFSTRSTTFKSGILRLTKGNGVDVVLNSLSGEQLSASWECVADFGTFIEIGKSDIYNRSQLSMKPFDKCASFVPVDLALMANSRPRLIHSGLKAVFELFEKGILSPVTPVTTFSMDHIEDAFRLIAARKHTGKLIVVADDTTMVKAVVPPLPQLSLARHGTYVVVGGLGDLGQRICRLLAVRGADNIVTLGRTTLPDGALASLRHEIEQLGGQLHPMQCDITDSAGVAEVSRFCRSNLPPVRGVIHGGMVLDDHPMEVMSLSEYNRAVRPKVHGTLNLNNAFASDSLDFFVALSSAAGILGTSGQANYAAGNTFQDAFAIAQTARPGNRTRYVTLDLGAVAGSNAITRLAASGDELKRQGLVFMTFEELYKGLEYAMSPWAIENNCQQMLLGFDGKSLSHIADGAPTRNPMFQRLLMQESELIDSGNGTDSESKEADPARLLENATSIEDAEDIILEATAGKFSVFLDTEVPTDLPIAKLALDSLVSIELKNWMVRTFNAPLQASELAGALSISALSKLLASRSKFIRDEVRLAVFDGASAQDNVVEVSQELAAGKYQDTNAEAEPTHGWMCCKHAKELAKFPLIGLDEAVDWLLDDMTSLCGPDELDVLRKAADDLRRSDGPARQAYTQLVNLHNDESLDSWMYNLISDAGYLKQRGPVAPYSSVVGTHHDSASPHSQSERATLISLAALQFRDEVEAEHVEPYWQHGMPLCTWQWKWLFNACRIPGINGDSMIRSKHVDWIAVLCRGHAYKVLLREGGVTISQSRLQATFEAVIDHSAKIQESWTGILTTDNRDSWAKIRAAMIDASTSNEKYLHFIEASGFVVCLDDGSPSTNLEHVRQAYLGTGFNRWMDKCTQFIVTANGRSSFILEHGAIDGMTASRLSERINQEIQTHTISSAADQSLQPTTDIAFEEYVFQSDPETDAHMNILRERYAATAFRIGYKHHTIRNMGVESLMSSAVPVKSVVDAIVQLAIRLHYGYNTQCWEGVSMAHYHKGRPDMMQVATSDVVGFCDMALDDTVPLTERRARLLNLGREMSARMQRCQSGGTFLRLFELLKVLWPKDAPMAELFAKNLYWRKPYVIANHAPVNSPICDSVWGIQEPNSVWVMTTPKSDSIEFSIAGGPVNAFAKRLDEAAQIIKRIVDAK